MHKRPLSPHLQIYKPQLTSVLSIFHRMAGVFVSLGIPFLVYWLWALSQGGDTYEDSRAFFGSFIGRTLLLFWSIAFFYHMCNGVRHLFWDAGAGFELDSVYRSGKLVVAAAMVLTLVAWLSAYSMRGGG